MRQEFPHNEFLFDLLVRLAILPIAHIEADDSRRAASWFAPFAPYRLSHGVGMLDSLIAAAALQTALPIYTFNLSHFAPIPGIDAR